MANNVMQEMRVYDGYLVGLMQISPTMVPEILPATSCACVGFSLGVERMMHHSRDKYFPQLRTKVSIQQEAQESLHYMHLHKLTNTCTQREKGVVNPFTVTNKSEI